MVGVNWSYRVAMVACAALDMPEWDLGAMGTGGMGYWGIGYWGHRDGRCSSRAPSLRGACVQHAPPRGRRAVKSSSPSGKGGLLGDPPPGRRDYGPFSQGGGPLKKGLPSIGSIRDDVLKGAIRFPCPHAMH